MTILRTETSDRPDTRFENLPDYPFAPHYVEIPAPDGQTLRMHYVDEGPADARETVLMLHGEPTWSFLYRKMIPIVAGAGHRVIAPDLIGFGKSDKILEPEAYSYQQHMDWLTAFVDALGLEQITLVCQDWGGLLGLRLVGQQPQRFRRVSASNTGLPTGDQPASDAFLAWQTFARQTPTLPIGQIVAGGCVQKLSPEVVAAYNAPFPDETYKAAARMFPTLVPTLPNDPASAPNRAAWAGLMQFQQPMLTCFSDSDPITKGGDFVLQKLVPGCKGQAHITIENAGHFVQEDQGEVWAEQLVQFLGHKSFHQQRPQ